MDVREKLVELLRDVQYLGGLEEKIADHLIENGVTVQEWISADKRMPTQEDAPVRHGRWIKVGYACGETEWQCSACKETEWRTSASRLKYCLFCGAKMDGGAE